MTRCPIPSFVFNTCLNSEVSHSKIHHFSDFFFIWYTNATCSRKSVSVYFFGDCLNFLEWSLFILPMFCQLDYLASKNWTKSSLNNRWRTTTQYCVASLISKSWQWKSYLLLENIIVLQHERCKQYHLVRSQLSSQGSYVEYPRI